eukprot:GHRR01025074.1.p1 GENE.GHRR01025074.1~~GHRR01025074.1.p1  ORF type:complete len:133 (+),score=4.67 GHRR01025074.1:868-1266(+)
MDCSQPSHYADKSGHEGMKLTAARSKFSAAAACLALLSLPWSDCSLRIRAACSVANFDAIGLIGYIKHAILNFLVDLSSSVDECLFHVVCYPSRCLQEDQSMLLSKLLTLLCGHSTTMLQAHNNSKRMQTQA